MPGTRSFAAGRFVLDLDGNALGFLRSVEGGAITAEVVTEPAGQTYYVQKHLAAPRYEELVVGADLSLDKTLYRWINDTWTGKTRRRDGSIFSLNAQLKAVSERQFFQALITEVTVPKMDAASKDPAQLTIKLAPEYTRLKAGSGGSLKVAASKQKAWQSRNFKLEIDNLDCKKVMRVDAFTVKQSIARGEIGEARDYVKQPGRLEFPNLRVTLPESAAQTWTAWFDDFVVKGNNDESHERSGKLTFVSADVKSALGEVSFFNLGIFRLETAPQTAGAEAVALVHADLYCERMELKVN